MPMRRFLAVLTLFLGLFGAFQLQAECAKCKLMAAWGLAAQPETLFDPDHIGRYEGQVLSVQDVAPATDVVDGVYALLKTEEGNMAVRLGPASYLKQHGFVVEPFDRLEVMASKVTTEGDQSALIATKAKIKEKTIALRDVHGVAMWSHKK